MKRKRVCVFTFLYYFQFSSVFTFGGALSEIFWPSFHQGACPFGFLKITTLNVLLDVVELLHLLPKTFEFILTID